MNLYSLFAKSVKNFPDNIAVKHETRSLSYSQLAEKIDLFAKYLALNDVGRGDAVAIWQTKSISPIIVMQAVLKLGAFYVPIDPEAPLERVKSILNSLQPKLIVTDRDKLSPLEFSFQSVSYCEESDSQLISEKVKESSDISEIKVNENEVAYCLFTSGSTGVPKGVTISHRNALSFIDWAVSEIAVTQKDVLANHAPFHFDLSVLDLYVSFCAGATVVLIPSALAYAPEQLVELIGKYQISVWYSVPSVLILMINHGELLSEERPSLRAIMFAGEPFSFPYVVKLREAFPSVRLLNLYGPTETNVCTFHEIKELPQSEIIPIGKQCSGNTVWLENAYGRVVSANEEGELIVAGPTVMLGYWGKSSTNTKNYRTGDIAKYNSSGDLEYVGRQDQMVKIKGHRIEVGDIEAALIKHPNILQVAVVVTGEAMEKKLCACIVLQPNSNISLIEVKQHCAKLLPKYMIVDRIKKLQNLVKTSNGKIDRKKLALEFN